MVHYPSVEHTLYNANLKLEGRGCFIEDSLF